MYLLKSTCIPVQGFCRGALYNLSTNEYYYIPISLCGLIANSRNTSDWLLGLSANDEIIVKEYIEFLLEKKCLIPLSDHNECFPTLSMDWHVPEKISILNIFYVENISNYLLFIRPLLINSKVKNVSLQFEGSINLLFELLEVFNNSYVNNLVLYLQFKAYEKTDFVFLIMRYPFISKIILLDAECNNLYYLDPGRQISVESTLQRSINNPKIPIRFVINHKFFAEAQLYNTFFNKRIFITQNGFISHTTNDVDTHGHVNRFEYLMEMYEVFLKYWHANKDKIEVCKDCEHRYMCYDSRTPIEKCSKWYYKDNCNYNPYIGKWQGEDGYVPVKQVEQY